MNLLYFIVMYGREYLAAALHPELGHELMRRGHGFSVFAMTSEAERRGRADNTLEEGIPVHRAVSAGRRPIDWVNRATEPVFKYSRFATGLAHYVRHLANHPEVDLVLAEGAYPVGAMAALASLVVPKPFLVTVAGGDFIASQEAKYGYGRFALPRGLMRLAFRRAAAIRATTPLVLEHIVRLGGDARKAGVVPRNLAAASYLPVGPGVEGFRDAAVAEVRARHGLGPGPLLLCAGRLLPIKGFDDAVRALPSVRRAFPDARLLFVGPDRSGRGGSYQQELQGLASELGVGGAVVFAGAVEHERMKSYLAAADLLLVPSILEGMNKVAVEAAAVSTPSVISRTAGIAPALVAAGAGVMIEPHAPAELAAAATALCLDEGRRRALGRSGLEFAGRFTAERTAAELMELCSWALRSHQAGGRLSEAPPSFEPGPR